MRYIFVDSGPFQALNNIEDNYYTTATQILEGLNEKRALLLTTDYIIDETYTGLLTTAEYKSAIHFDQFLQKSPLKIIFISESIDDHFTQMGFRPLS